jgi:predicted nucleic acid-binding protein
MPAERRNFHDRLEGVIYWNSSFATAYFDDTEAYHRQCLEFANRLETERVLSVSSDFVHNELAFVFIRDALLAEARRTGQHWRDVYRHRSDIVIATMPQAQVNRAELNRLTLLLPVPDTVQNRAFQLMEAYALLPTDAYHVAIALDAGVSAFVSLDEDLLRVDGIIVYTCLPQPVVAGRHPSAPR